VRPARAHKREKVPDEKLLTLLKMYRAVEKPLIWGLIPASRRNNTYALNITDEYIEQCARCGPRSFSRYGPDHYHAVSYGAMSEQESVEIRWAHGTTQYERIVNWVIFHLKFIHSVYRGMNLESINDITTIEELLDRIGLSEETGTSPIVKARKWCLKRFYEDIDGAAGRKPRGTPRGVIGTRMRRLQLSTPRSRPRVSRPGRPSPPLGGGTF